MWHKFIIPLCTMVFYSSYTMADYMSTPTFIDPACIAPQMDMSQGGPSVNMNTASDIEKAGARFKIPTYLTLRVSLYNNLLKFVKQNITAAKGGIICDNPLQEQDCVVLSYKMPDGSAITNTNIYKYVVYSSLYDYISSSVLDHNDLETLRTLFAKGYANTTIDTSFETAMTNIIATTGLSSSGITNQKISDVLTIIDESSEQLSSIMVKDVLFYQKFGHSSYGRFPIMARLIECLDGTFANLLYRDLPHLPLTPYKVAQTYFSPIIMLCLIVYLIIEGYKILMAQGIKEKNDIIMFVVQFGLVFYFTIGNAWQDFFFEFINSISSTISGIILESMPGSADGCSVYKPTMYPRGKGYIALFDAVDCKFLNYIGLPGNAWIPGLFSIIALTILMPVPYVSPVVNIISIIYLFSIINTILMGVQIYITATVNLMLLIFLSIIIIPLSLFNITKDIFDKWVTKIIGTVIQKIMAVMMIVITMIMLDSVIYGTNTDALFNKTSHIDANGTPYPNSIKNDCYGGAWNILQTFDFDSGLILGVVPPACVLNIYATHPWSFFKFPLHFIWLFRIPVPLVHLIVAFLIPAILAILMMYAIKMVVGSMEKLISTVSGIDSEDTFGASAYSSVEDGIARAKEAKDKGGE
ncbi:MAG: type IV secretory pathway VirB6-like protein [Candidatus Deianiraeaceae bacterium]|jgi:type IV secretory pathway VirB6-like protein